MQLRRLGDTETTSPPPQILELDGYEIRRMREGDLEIVKRLQSSPVHGALLNLPDQDEMRVRFLQTLQSQVWGLPMLCLYSGEPIGLMATTMNNVSGLNANLVVCLDEAHARTTALALYVRSVFWNFPVHRLYMYCPLNTDFSGYAHLLQSVGFEQEGALREHMLVGGRTYDVGVFGLLRSDFERWVDAHDCRLKL